MNKGIMARFAVFCVLLILTSVAQLSPSAVGGTPESTFLRSRSFLDPFQPSWQQSLSWSTYHNYSEVVSWLSTLNTSYPMISSVFSIGKSFQGRDIYCIRLTNESIVRAKPAVFFVGLHHAREMITTELALYFVDYAVTNFGVNPDVTRILNDTEVYVVPMLNVDGSVAVRQNDWQRKNARPIDEDYDGRIDEDTPWDLDGDGRVEYLWNYRTGATVTWEGTDVDGDGIVGEDWIGGVDLNRNYGYEWNASADSGSPYPTAEDYRGPSPFSELETKAIQELVMQYDFHYAISLHSGANVILYPWGYANLPTDDDSKFRSLASYISALVSSPYEQSSQLYTTSGVWDDWMYGNQSVYALTFEIYNNESAWVYEPGAEPYTEWIGGILQVFDPSPSKILETVQKWMPALLYTANRAATDYLAGDVNHDGSVDILDVVSLTAIYGLKSGMQGWKPKLDLRRDGEIDILDVVAVTSNYGGKLME